MKMVSCEWPQGAAAELAGQDVKYENKEASQQQSSRATVENVMQLLPLTYATPPTVASIIEMPKQAC